MFNIVGFHLTTKLTQKQKQSICRKHGLCSSALELDPRLYSNSKSASHLAKEERKACKALGWPFCGCRNTPWRGLHSNQTKSCKLI